MNSNKKKYDGIGIEFFLTEILRHFTDVNVLHNRFNASLAFVSVFFLSAPAFAVSPTLYSQSAYQSPVRGEPDDLLLIPGYGFAANDIVVYQAIADTTQLLTPPTSVPNSSTAVSGVAPVISAANVPDSLTVKLPLVMQSNQSYALWVRNSNGEWSNGIKINDARPFWITPDYAYVTGAVASLPRYMKVIGRNLQPTPSANTQIRLVQTNGSASFTLNAANDGSSNTAIEHYVAKINLPTNLPAGSYTVQVNRDGVSWVTLNGQVLTVKADPIAQNEFHVGAYGGCIANDGSDDTACIVNAINAAKNNHGGVVVFDSGVWNMNNSSNLGPSGYGDGILVPVGVSLRGAGAALTTLVRGAGWDVQANNASFTLQGSNTVQGFTFKDNRIYQPGDTNSVILKLGKIYYRANAGDPTDPKLTSDVTITQNVFDKPLYAISDGGLPIQHLFVTYNEFGAYKGALEPSGNRYNITYKFHVDDSVIAYNTFKPGSYIDTSTGQGTIASEIGASRRLDFSNNIADGASTQYFYNPTNDAKGWRAAFFWHMNNNQEMTLVSGNTATCTGDKTGDGEAIWYDNNANTFGFSQAQSVLTPTTNINNTVTVPGPLVTTQNTKSLLEISPITGQPFLNDYYNEHWVQIAQGPGVGQVRRIVSYTIDPSGSPVTFTVFPDWDVIPQATSRLTMAREFWQVYTVDNFVDHRTPLCLNTKQRNSSSSPAVGGGTIGLWAQTADSAVEGNQQYDTNGIVLQQSYSADDPACCTSNTFFQSFVEVRGNTIDHEYNWGSDCSWSGLWGSYSASPTPSSPPPVAGYGVSFARNTIIQADGFRGGAITLSRSWYGGPSPYNWKLVNNTLIHHNVIRNVAGPVSPQVCDVTQSTRIGIHLDDPLVQQTVLYANSCNNVTTLLRDDGVGTAHVCPSGVLNSCECTESDMGVTMTASPATAIIGDIVTYVIHATNNGLSTASGVSLTDILSSGMSWISTTTTQGSCSNNGQTVTCGIGGLINGGAATITIVARVTTSGAQVNYATVSNSVESDPNAANNTVSISTNVLPSCQQGSYKLSGTVTRSSNNTAISDVTLTLKGTNCGDKANTNTKGKYTFTALLNDDYTVTPAKSGCTSFNPASKSLTLYNTDKTNVNFTGACP